MWRLGGEQGGWQPCTQLNVVGMRRREGKEDGVVRERRSWQSVESGGCEVLGPWAGVLVSDVQETGSHQTAGTLGRDWGS